MRTDGPADPLSLENEELRQEVRTAREAADITAQLVAEQFEETERVLALFQAANAQREAVLNAASRISIIATDPEGRITLFNHGAERMLGYAAAEVVGRRTPLDFHLASEIQGRCAELSRVIGEPVEGWGLFLEYVRRQIATEQEWTYVRKDGTHTHVSMSVTGVRGADGDLVGLLAAAMDITHLKQQEERLRQAMAHAESANRTKSTFLANMSHELRTPLNAIIGYSEMLEEEAEDLDRPEFVEDLRKIHTAGRHLLALINDVLDLSKIEAGKVELFVEPFAITGMVEDVASTVKPLIEKKRNRLEIHVADGIGAMKSDLMRTRQVLFNLLSNASKFTEGGTITLEAFAIGGAAGAAAPAGATGSASIAESAGAAAPAGEQIVFRIHDTGIGMSPEQIARIFEPFVQADPTTTRKFGGTGLGLTISRTFCRMMGGDIAVESRPGEGSTFTVTLPREVKPKREGNGEPVERPKPRGGVPAVRGPNTVLIIDDDPAVHDLLGNYLEKDGFDVVTASSGTEGLRLAREVKPAVITLDILMPGMDGWAVLMALKADPETSAIPVVIITIEENRNLGFTLGASDFLVKPVSHLRLFETLRKYRRVAVTGSVLVVEDEKETRDLLVRLIRKEGWDVSEAEHGRAALDRLAERKPDLIFLDLMMPVMDGFEFIREIRAREEYQLIPIVVVTAKDLTPDERQWLNGNVYQVFRKGSYSRDELMHQIREIVLRHVGPLRETGRAGTGE